MEETINPLELSPEQINCMIGKLSPRQIEVMICLVQGMSCKQIAYTLSLAIDTVKQHIRRARQKLELENKTQLIVLFAVWSYLKRQEAIRLGTQYCVYGDPFLKNVSMSERQVNI